MDADWKRRLLDMDAGAERVRYLERQKATKKSCEHYSCSQAKVTGEYHCDACGKLLIDSIGRVLE
jgi:hypothetical protein